MLKLETNYGETLNVWFHLATYCNNNRQYIGLNSENTDYEVPFPESYCDITVNLPDETPDEGCVFIDDSLMPEIGKWLQDNGFGEPTGYYGMSGHAVYPEYHMHMDKIMQHVNGPELDL